jgi:long-chain acyl-CoA synthetase
MESAERFRQLCQQLSVYTKTDSYPFLGELLQRAALLWPNNKALIADSETLTYADLYAHAAHFSLFLQQKGVQEREKVVLWYENSFEFYRATFAILQAGAIVVPVNSFMSFAELEHIFIDAQVRFCIVSDELAKKIQPEATSDIIYIRKADFPILPDGVPSAYEVKKLSVHELAVLLYTSGTTGKPKGVMLSSHALITNALQGLERLEITDKDRVLVALPLFHSLMQNSGIWAPFIAGASCIIVPKIERKALLQGLSQEPTIIVGVPLLFNLFCLFRTARFDSVRYFISGGEPLSDKTRKYFELVYNRKLCNGYGLSETAPFIGVDLEDRFKETATVGRPLYGIRVEIRSENNEPLPQGEIGQLWVTGENLMLGYYRAPEATAAVFNNGWLATGDLAFITSYGEIVIAGRTKELIVHKGIKIYPQEIEELLLKHPDVLYVAVVGRQENDTEFPVAYIATKRYAEAELLTQELTQLCTQALAFYKIPRQFIIEKELPLTPTGKIAKKKLS